MKKKENKSCSDNGIPLIENPEYNKNPGIVLFGMGKEFAYPWPFLNASKFIPKVKKKKHELRSWTVTFGSPVQLGRGDFCLCGSDLYEVLSTAKKKTVITLREYPCAEFKSEGKRYEVQSR